MLFRYPKKRTSRCYFFLQATRLFCTLSESFGGSAAAGKVHARRFTHNVPFSMQSSRMRYLAGVLFAILMFGGAVSPAQAQFGVAAGLNFETASDIETNSNDNATFDNSTGYHLGVVYQLGAGAVSLRPGLLYRRVGTYDFSTSGQFDLTAWEVPVDLRLTVLPAPLVSPYVLGGAQATFPQGDDEFDDALEDVSYSFNVGAGVEISIPSSSLELQPEFRYQIGATSFVQDDFELGGTSFSPAEQPQFSAIGLRLNVLF